MSTDAIAPNLIPDMQPAATAEATPFDDLDAVVATHQKRIFRFLLSSLREPDLAHTLTQETFLRAWTTRNAFRGECSIAGRILGRHSDRDPGLHVLAQFADGQSWFRRNLGQQG